MPAFYGVLELQHLRKQHRRCVACGLEGIASSEPLTVSSKMPVIPVKVQEIIIEEGDLWPEG
jgi:hypothetical protein